MPILSVPSSGSGASNVVTVANFGALPATGAGNVVYYVVDASGDSTVTSGPAWYQWETSAYVKIAEGESNNIILATDTLTGIVRLATNSESEDASETGVVVTPSQLHERIKKAPQFTEVDVSSSTTLTTAGNLLVNVDTSTSPVSLTLNTSPTAGQKITVSDDGGNSGTNIISIVAGAKNYTIEADGGAKEFIYNGVDWELSGGFQNYFQRNALTNQITTLEPDKLVADQLIGGDLGTVFSGGVSDFSNPGANVDQDAEGWGNLPEYTPFTDYIGNVVKGGTWSTGDADSAFSPIAATCYPNATCTFTFPTPRTIDYVRKLGAGRQAEVTAVRDSDGGTNALGTLYTDGIIQVDDGVTYRSISIKFTGSAGWQTAAQIEVGNLGSRSTLNTFEHVILQAGSSTKFDPSTLALTDDADAPLADGDLTIKWSGDNGSTWSSSYGLNAFKSLGVITDTDFRLEYTPVGTTTVKTSVIQSASSYAKMTSTGLDIVVEGVSQGVVESGATDDQTGAEIEGLLDAELGNTNWKGIGGPNVVNTGEASDTDQSVSVVMTDTDIGAIASYTKLTVHFKQGDLGNGSAVFIKPSGGTVFKSVGSYQHSHDTSSNNADADSGTSGLSLNAASYGTASLDVVRNGDSSININLTGDDAGVTSDISKLAVLVEAYT